MFGGAGIYLLKNTEKYGKIIRGDGDVSNFKKSPPQCVCLIVGSESLSYTFIYGKLEDLENFMASFETHPAKKRLVGSDDTLRLFIQRLAPNCFCNMTPCWRILMRFDAFCRLHMLSIL